MALEYLGQHLDGGLQNAELHLDNHWDWEKGYFISTALNGTWEGLREPFEIYPGVVVPAGRAGAAGWPSLRAAWADAGVEGVIGWVKLTGHEGVEYELELHDRVVGLGGSLLMQQHQIRSVVLNATGQLMPRLKAEQWEPKAALLARTAQEQRVSALRQSDRVNEWLDELLPTANDGETVEERRSLLATGPILYDGALAIRTRRLLLLAENLTADEALSWNLVEKVVDPAELDDATLELARLDLERPDHAPGLER